METNHNQVEPDAKKPEGEEKKDKPSAKPKKQQYKTTELVYETRSHALPPTELVEYTEREV